MRDISLPVSGNQDIVNKIMMTSLLKVVGKCYENREWKRPSQGWIRVRCARMKSQLGVVPANCHKIIFYFVDDGICSFKRKIFGIPMLDFGCEAADWMRKDETADCAIEVVAAD